MSIQSSITSALGAVETSLLRVGTALKPHTAAPSAEDSNESESPVKESAETQKPEKTAPQAATVAGSPEMNAAAEIITNGNITAGAIAQGRVQAKQQQLAASRSSGDRLQELRERKRAAQKELLAIKHEERTTKYTSKKKGGGI